MSNPALLVDIVPTTFNRWEELHALLVNAYAYMDKRVNPPTSMHQLSVDGLREKAQSETLITAIDDGSLVGCLFAKPEKDHLYVGKLAVADQAQGKGVGRKLLSRAEDLARDLSLSRVQLFTRIELVENHKAFQKCGYGIVGHGTHEGFDAPTYVRMGKLLV